MRVTSIYLIIVLTGSVKVSITTLLKICKVWILPIFEILFFAAVNVDIEDFGSFIIHKQQSHLEKGNSVQ